MYLDELEMFVEEEPVADADFPESLGPANLGPDASSIFPLLGQPHPVVPVRSRPSKSWFGIHLLNLHTLSIIWPVTTAVVLSSSSVGIK